MEYTTIGIPRRLELIDRRGSERRVRELIWILKDKYRVIRYLGEKTVDPTVLYSTQKYLEADKLGLVLREILMHSYNVPIIAVRGHSSRQYILDGHHRARVALWLRRKISSHLLFIPEYKPRISVKLSEIQLINTHETLPGWIEVWKHMVNIIYFLERKYQALSYIWRETLRINELIPTQKILPVTHYRRVREPILVYKYMDKYYIIDGHNRACASLLEGGETIASVVFTLFKHIRLIDYAGKLGMKHLTPEICIHGS